jgi:hypothetical protein
MSISTLIAYPSDSMATVEAQVNTHMQYGSDVCMHLVCINKFTSAASSVPKCWTGNDIYLLLLATLGSTSVAPTETAARGTWIWKTNVLSVDSTHSRRLMRRIHFALYILLARLSIGYEEMATGGGQKKAGADLS